MRLAKANPCSTVLVAPGGGLSREARAFDLAGTIHSVGPHAFALFAKGWAAVGIEFLLRSRRFAIDPVQERKRARSVGNIVSQPCNNTRAGRPQ